MCRGIKGKEKEELFIDDIDNYTYLNSSGCTTVDTINDSDMYDTVSKALENIFGPEKRSILEILSAILLFGNVKIDPVPENESSKVANPEVVEKIGKLLQIDPKVIEEALTKLKGKDFLRLYNQNKAMDSRNACAKTLYSKLFNFVINGINKKFMEQQKLTGKESLLGVLDIYGFELFENNSFEQLCINYANERLHQHFVIHTFKREKDLYATEGITFVEAKFKDNESIVKLIDHPIDGIFACLDDEIRMPKPSDEKLLGRMNQKYAPQKDVYSRDIKNPKAFRIHHYTSPVAYKVTNFLEKAKDEVSWNILGMFGDSTHPVLKQIFKPADKLTPEEVKGMKQSLGIQYKLEMNSLIEHIEKGEPYYIKCIIPNRDKLSMCFDHSVVREQLRSNGVLESLEICHKGFALKMSIEEFVKKYKIICRGSAQDFIAGADKSLVQMGKNMVFLNDDEMALLESQKKAVIDRCVKRIVGCKLGLKDW